MYTLSSTGDMTKNVRNSASPISTWLGGEVCVPSAWRSSDSTMMMRVKLLIIRMMAGRNPSDVRKTSVCTGSE